MPEPFSAVLRRARVRAGVTQQELARRMDTSQGTISWIESGKRELLMSTVLRFAQALGQEAELVIRRRKEQADAGR